MNRVGVFFAANLYIFSYLAQVIIKNSFMSLKQYTFLFCLLSFAKLAAQPILYNDASTLITGTWAAAGTTGTANIAEVTTGGAYEGTKHYKFDYNYDAWWAGVGLNMNNWGTGAAKNLSGYTYLKVAYKGLSGSQTLSVTLRNINASSNQVQVGGADPNYAVAYVSIAALVNGSAVSANAVTEINFSVGGVQVGSGTVYIDAIELTNTAPTGGVAASAATWARANSLGRGLNTSNWLEAYWMLPNNYPEPGRYTRAKIYNLRAAGFESFRLPIIFERITPTTAPYTINWSHPALVLVDSMVAWANEMNFKLIIDNHHGYDLTNANYIAETPRLQAIWAQIATKYGNLDPNRYLFEIYNEATPTISNANFRNLAAQVVSTIRANEAVTHSIIVGASGWNSGPELTNFVPLNDADIIYTFHNYDSYQFTHQGMSWTNPAYMPARAFPLAGEVAAINNVFANVKTWSNTNQVPVFLGEFGCSTAADATSRCNWMQTLTSAIQTNNFGYFYWDAISPTDAFGFFAGGTISQATAIPCFASALGIYTTPLAVEFTDFRVECNGDRAELIWDITHSDTDAEIQIQTSQDAITWQQAARKQVRAGEAGSFRWTDTESAPYYRLKTTETNGKTTYSEIQSAPCTPKPQLALYPNPARSEVYLEGVADCQITVLDMTGRVVLSSLDAEVNQSDKLRLETSNLPQGAYAVRVQRANGGVEMRSLVVVK
jgi:endoglucanase